MRAYEVFVLNILVRRALVTPAASSGLPGRPLLCQSSSIWGFTGYGIGRRAVSLVRDVPGARSRLARLRRFGRSQARAPSLHQLHAEVRKRG